LRGLGNVPQDKGYLAEILSLVTSDITLGASYQGGTTEVSKTTLLAYDSFNRLTSRTNVNDPIRYGNNAITNIDYYCPGSHPENPGMFCNLPQKITNT
jgi:hypothetical protein